MNENYAIWWLAQQATEMIVNSNEIMATLPGYVADQVKSRYGRPGRGRLWVDDEIPIEEIEWNDEKPMAALAAMCGGIVFHLRDLPTIVSLPGFVTDLKLDSIPLAEMSDRFNPVMERLSYLNEIYYRGSIDRNKRYNNVMDVLQMLMEAYNTWLN